MRFPLSTPNKEKLNLPGDQTARWKALNYRYALLIEDHAFRQRASQHSMKT
jgi:hypothetical protein